TRHPHRGGKGSAASVGPHRWIDLSGPGVDAAGEVDCIGKAARAQELDRPRAAATVMAHDDERRLARQLADALDEARQGDVDAAVETADLQLPRLADVENRGRATPPGELCHRDLEGLRRIAHGQKTKLGCGTKAGSIGVPASKTTRWPIVPAMRLASTTLPMPGVDRTAATSPPPSASCSAIAGGVRAAATLD